MDPLQNSLRTMGGVVIDLDYSFVIQLGIVLVLMVLLKQLIFEPYLKSIVARDARTDEARDDADALRKRAAELSDRYAAGLHDAREAAFEARQALRITGAAEKEAVVTEARQDAARTLEEGHTQAATQFEAARTKLLAQVDDIARLVVEKVLGRGV
ncbi:MAG: ATP synthase F0 subunit B [Myxococcales bacterium]|nr:ATP synthase F0 subunit B [Myxococcales bacterium]